MIKKISITNCFIFSLFVLFTSYSKLYAANLLNVEIKLSVHKDIVDVSFLARDKINFDIINEHKQLKIISYSPIKFIFKPEVNEDIFPKSDQISLKIDENAQGFVLTGAIFDNSDTSQVEKKLNGFSYSIKKEQMLKQILNLAEKSFFEVSDQQWFFNFSSKTASAVFFRENFLWVVFNEYKKFENISEALALDKNIKSITQIPSFEHTILRFELNEVKNAEIKKDKTTWILDWRLNKDSPNNRKSINQYLSPNAKGIFFPINNYIKSIIDVLDPDMQDTLKIVISEEENHGVDYERSFVDFMFLKTVQGAVVNIFNDRSHIDLLDNGIEIILPKERVINKNTEPEFFINDNYVPTANNDLDSNSLNNSLLKTEITNDKYFLEGFLKALNLTIENDNLASLNAIAKFYFKNQFYRECAGILNKNFLKIQEPSILMQGVVSNYYHDNYFAADKLLTQLIKINDGKNEEELDFWQNLIRFSMSKDSRSINFLAFEKKILNHYPAEIKNKIVIAEVEENLEKNKNFDQMPALLDYIENNAFKRKNIAYSKYLKSIYYLKKNENKKAKSILEELSESFDPRCKLLATLTLVEHLLANYKISHLEAIDKLMKVRFVWRGGVEEYKLLTMLKDLYTHLDDKIAALSMTKLMLAYDLPKHDSFYLVAEISKLLTDVFLNHQNLKDIKVISLFYEYKEMLPVGTLGDEIILSIAKRMVNLDMMDKATAILEHQMKFRQNDNNKAAIGVDLAEIYLLDNKNEKALATLLEIKNVKSEQSLQGKQKYLLAKSYFRLSKYQQVKKILENDVSAEASEILIDIYLKEQNWYALQLILELKVFQIPFEKNISEKSKNYIEKLLFSYYIQGKTNAIAELRKMLDDNGLSKQYFTFKLLTDFLQQDLLSVSSKSVKEYLSLESLEEFLKGYKNYLKLPVNQS